MVRKGAGIIDNITGYFTGTPAAPAPAPAPATAPAAPSTPVKEKNVVADMTPKPASPDQSTTAVSPDGKTGGRSRKRVGKSKKVRKSKKTRKQKRRS